MWPRPRYAIAGLCLVSLLTSGAASAEAPEVMDKPNATEAELVLPETAAEEGKTNSADGLTRANEARERQGDGMAEEAHREARRRAAEQRSQAGEARERGRDADAGQRCSAKGE